MINFISDEINKIEDNKVNDNETLHNSEAHKQSNDQLNKIKYDYFNEREARPPEGL